MFKFTKIRHHGTDGSGSQHLTVKLLSYQFRRFAAQNDITAAQMRFQFVQLSLDLPAFTIQSRQGATQSQFFWPTSAAKPNPSAENLKIDEQDCGLDFFDPTDGDMNIA